MVTSHVFASFADDDHKFAFIVQFGSTRAFGNDDRRTRILHSVGAFDEGHGIITGTHAYFVGVPAIIMADAPSHHRQERREKLSDVLCFLSDAIPADGIAFHAQLGPAGLLGGIVNLSGVVHISN